LGVSENDLRLIAEHGYEGAASADQDQQAQAVMTRMRSIRFTRTYLKIV
jgi:hypothetical protein